MHVVAQSSQSLTWRHASIIGSHGVKTRAFVTRILFSGKRAIGVEYTQGQVQPKYLINATNFPYGFVTPNDSWSNRWRGGVNASLGWSPSLPGSGSGAKSLGTELESAAAFAQCQVTKVFQAVCFRAPASATDQQQVSWLTQSFTNGGYKLKQVFQQTAAYCPGT